MVWLRWCLRFLFLSSGLSSCWFDLASCSGSIHEREQFKDFISSFLAAINVCSVFCLYWTNATTGREVWKNCENDFQMFESLPRSCSPSEGVFMKQRAQQLIWWADVCPIVPWRFLACRWFGPACLREETRFPSVSNFPVSLRAAFWR